MMTDALFGRGYMSFQCDGHVIKERRYYCCKINGQLWLACITLALVPDDTILGLQDIALGLQNFDS
jgi:hypothetical protein